MNVWLAVVVGSIAVYSWKYLGYLIPSKVLENKKLLNISGSVTIALLSALVGIQTFTEGKNMTFDARVPALLVAVALLKLKVPFIVIVLAGAAVAATLRLIL